MVCNHNRGAPGFSLVELMIVIVIIGVLVGAAVPIYKHNLELAKRTEAVASIGSIRDQLNMHYAIEGSYPISDIYQKVIGLDWNDINTGELTGKYFKDNNYRYRSYDGIEYRIKCNKNRLLSKTIWLDQSGHWRFDENEPDEDD